MKRFFLYTGLAVLSLACLAYAGQGDEQAKGQETAWFDMQHCAVCKILTEDPHLMEHMTWETHTISDGAVTVTTVDPEYRAAYEKAVKAMHELSEKMHSGKVDPSTVPLCNHCRTYGMLMQDGVRIESIDGHNADVTVMTSDDPELLARIKDYARRNNEAMAQMETMQAGMEY